MVARNGGKNSGAGNPPENLDVYFTAEALSTRSKEFLTKTYSISAALCRCGESFFSSLVAALPSYASAVNRVFHFWLQLRDAASFVKLPRFGHQSFLDGTVRFAVSSAPWEEDSDDSCANK
jgi:hypothetical protein